MKSNVEIDKRLVIRGSASGLLAHIINIGLLLWFNQYLIRRISPAEYSLYPIVMSIMSFLMIVRGCLNTSNSRYVTEAYARGDNETVTRISSTMFAYSMIVSLFLLIGGAFFCWHIDQILVVAPHLVRDARAMITIIILSLTVNILTSPFEAGIRTKQKYVTINVINVLVQVLRLFLLAVLIFGVSTRVLWVVVATESAKLFGITVRVLISLRLIPALRFSPSHIDFRQGRQLLSFGGWSFIGGITFRIRNSVDPIILNQLATPLDVTCFHIGTLFFRHMNRARIMATDSLIPSLIAMYTTGQTVRLRNAFLKYGRIMVWSYMLFALPFMIYASDFTLLYVGKEYLAAIPVIIMVLASEIPYLGVSMISRLAEAQARVKNIAIRSIIVQIFNLGLTLYLVGTLRMGALGSALGTLVSGVFIRSVIMIPLGLRLANLDVKTWLARTVLPGFIPSVAGTAVWLTLKLIHTPGSWFKLIAFGAVGAAVYLLVLFTVSLQPDDKKDIKKFIRFLPFRK